MSRQSVCPPTITTAMVARLAAPGPRPRATGIIAAGLGTLASWAILVFIMHLEWTFLPSVALITVLVCVLLTLVVGFAGAWKALGAKASQHLRNE